LHFWWQFVPFVLLFSGGRVVDTVVSGNLETQGPGSTSLVYVL